MIEIDDESSAAASARPRSEPRTSSSAGFVRTRGIGHDVVHFGVHVPLDILGNRGAFLLLLQTLEDLQLGFRLVRAPGCAEHVE